MEVLKLAELPKEQETMVYGLGAVKLLASSGALREEIMAAGVLALLEDCLRGCCEAPPSGGGQATPTAGEVTHMRNVLIQVCWVKGLWYYKLHRMAGICSTQFVLCI